MMQCAAPTTLIRAAQRGDALLRGCDNSCILQPVTLQIPGNHLTGQGTINKNWSCGQTIAQVP